MPRTRFFPLARSTGQLQTFRALSHPAFRRLWMAAWLVYIARAMELIVLSWLVLQITDSPSMVSLVGVGRMAPMFLLGLAAGSLADRVPKKTSMMIALSITSSSYAFMFSMLVIGMEEPWHALLAISATGSAWAIDFASRRSYFSEIFDRSTLGQALSLDVATMMASMTLGPLLGGGLIALLGFTGTYGLMLALAIGAFGLLTTIPSTGPVTGRAPASVPTQVLEIVRTVRGSRVVWSALLVTLTLNVFGLPYLQMVPVIARDELGVGSTLYGVLAAAAGLGSVMGALVIASRVVQRRGTLYSLGAATMLGAITLFALSPLYPLAVLLLLLAGMGQSGFATMQAAIALGAVPPELRGRVMGAVALGIGASPLGLLVVGQLAEALGPRIALALLAGTGFLIVHALRLWLPELRDRFTASTSPQRQGGPALHV